MAVESLSFVKCFFSSPFVAAVTYVDSSAVQALKDLYHEYKSRDVQVESPFNAVCNSNILRSI